MGSARIKQVIACIQDYGEEVNLSGIQVTHEDASALTKAIADSRRLRRVYLDNIRIATTDVCHLVKSVQENPQLVEFQLRGINIDAECAKELHELLVKCRSLNTLQLKDSYLAVLNVMLLAPGLAGCQQLRVLDLGNNQLGADSALGFASALKSTSKLIVLRLGDNDIGSEGCMALVNALLAIPGLIEIDLRNNQIGPEGGKALATLIKTPLRNLRRLELSDNQIGPKSAMEIFKGLQNCPDLSSLFMSNNNVGQDATATLAVTLNRCRDFSNLDLSGNNIGRLGGMAIAVPLRSCGSLSYLRLDDNNIGEEAGMTLARALGSCKKLTYISLQNNAIGPDAACTLAASLRNCGDLTHLLLSNNNIGARGAKALAGTFSNFDGRKRRKLGQVLRGYWGLQAIVLNQNQIGPDASTQFAQVLKGHKDLRSIGFGNNNCGSKAASAFAEVIQGCEYLYALNLEDNNLPAGSSQMIARALNVSTCLEVLHFGGNDLGVNAGPALANSLRSCTKLTQVSIQNTNIGAPTAIALAEILRNCCTSSKLDLRGNDFTPEAIQILQNIVEESQTKVNLVLNDEEKDEGNQERLTSGNDNDDDGDSQSGHQLLELASSVSENLDARSDVLEDDVLSGGLSEPQSFHGDCDRGICILDRLSSDIALFRVKQTISHLNEDIALLRESMSDDLSAAIRMLQARSADKRWILQKMNEFEDFQTQLRGSNKINQTSRSIRDRDAARKILNDDLCKYVAKTPQYEAGTTSLQAFLQRLRSRLEELGLDENDKMESEMLDADLNSIVETAQQNIHATLHGPVETWISDHDVDVWTGRKKQALQTLSSRVQDLGYGDPFSMLVLARSTFTQGLDTELHKLQEVLEDECRVLRRQAGDKEPTKSVHHSLRVLEQALTQAFDACNSKTGLEQNKGTIEELHRFIFTGMQHPDCTTLEMTIEKLGQYRDCTEDLRHFQSRLARPKPGANRQDIENEIQMCQNIIAETDARLLGETIRYERSMLLRFAGDHYPELLHDETWQTKIGITSPEYLGISKCGLWLSEARIADFEVIQQLSLHEGRYVALVRDVDGQEIVLKRFSLADPKMTAQFIRQAEALSRIHSNHVIQIAGIFVDTSVDGITFGCVLMPYYRRGDLSRWLADNLHANDETRKRLAIGILNGVREVHQHGHVHCDIKPANVFLSENLTPVLGDFDGVQEVDRTISRNLQGTPRYLAPELMQEGSRHTTPMVDMYSIGVLLEDLFPNPSEATVDLITSLKQPEPSQRPSADEALSHRAFNTASVPSKTCILCLDDDASALSGVSCGNGHFVCEDCLSRAVQSATELQSSVHVSDNGAMECSVEGCGSSFHGTDIAQHVSSDIFEALIVIVRERAARRAEKIVEERMQAMMLLDSLTRDAERHLKFIRDRILSTCCPHCHAVFSDFEGCCALKCSNSECKYYFCAWCLDYPTTSTQECHQHVATCPGNVSRDQDPFYPESFECVEEAWRGLRAKRIHKYWENNIPEGDVREMVRGKLTPLLTADIVGPGFVLPNDD